MSTYAERSRALLRAAVLDEVFEAVTAGRYAELSMADLAARVGVSRQTLYNEFGSREGVIAALVARENTAILSMVTETLEAHPGHLAEGTAAATAAVLTRAADDPLTKMLLGADPELLPLFTVRAEPLLEHFVAAMHAYAETHYPDLARRDAAVLIDAVVRLVHSHVVLPHHPPEYVARQIYRLVDLFVHAAVAADVQGESA